MLDKGVRMLLSMINRNILALDECLFRVKARLMLVTYYQEDKQTRVINCGCIPSKKGKS